MFKRLKNASTLFLNVYKNYEDYLLQKYQLNGIKRVAHKMYQVLKSYIKFICFTKLFLMKLYLKFLKFHFLSYFSSKFFIKLKKPMLYLLDKCLL